MGGPHARPLGGSVVSKAWNVLLYCSSPAEVPGTNQKASQPQTGTEMAQGKPERPASNMGRANTWWDSHSRQKRASSQGVQTELPVRASTRQAQDWTPQGL
ncbi:hypothetical protein NDU88_006455 [Pleurodeles waltl]|uniref:Uncharacterized protein n=1 Tax=Pleurodeles waltl TaxID=8319 RepID=A0AAV7L7D3_PLEWA|nr:hypothetical protein NDU88_006455 [Pleurodeles waltl]